MCDLLSITYLPEKGSINLDFFLHENNTNTNIECNGILLFKISNTLDDFELPYVVDVQIKELLGEIGQGFLEKAGYSWKEYLCPEVIYHLHCEGGTIIDIFFVEKFQLQSKVVSESII